MSGRHSKGPRHAVGDGHRTAGRHRRPDPPRGRQLSAVAAASAVAGGMVALPGTAGAAVPTDQSLETDPATVPAGEVVTFTGELTSGGAPVANQPVDLVERDGAGDSWQTVTTATTGPQGRVSVPQELRDSGEWKFVYRGGPVLDSTASQPVPMQVEEPLGRRVVEEAASHEGTPYEYGADGPEAFDCSGLTSYVYEQFGVELPRSSQAQRDATEEIPQDQKRPGDLIFLDDGGEVHHVAIYAGNGKVWTAPQPGESVQLDDISDSDYTVGRPS